MKRFKIFYDFEKEEKYLHDMAEEGHILKKYSVFGFYHFEDTKPQNLNYKIDYRILKVKRILITISLYLKMQAGDMFMVRKTAGINIFCL